MNSDQHHPPSPIAEVSAALRAKLLRRVRRGMGPTLLGLHDPEDILHDALLTAEGSREGFRAGDLCAWIACIARNRILNLHQGTLERTRPRDRSSLPLTLLGPSAAEEPSTHPDFGRDEAREDAQRALILLGRLPVDQRICILLRDLMGVSWRTIGFGLGRSPEAVRRLHGRARSRIESMRSGRQMEA